MTFKVLGISSGIGVSLFPFREEVMGNCEPRAIFHTPKSEIWVKNFPGVPLVKDFESLKAEIPRGEGVDVILSSPDCGSGSVFRYSRAKELGNHKFNASLGLFFRGIRYYKPKLFMFENLEALFKSYPKEEFESKLSDYRLVIHSASVCMWGNSQISRKRLVVIGIRRDLSEHIDKFFELPDYRGRNRTSFELYGDLDQVNVYSTLVKYAHVREDPFSQVTMYSGFKLSVAQVTIQWQTVLKGKRRWDVVGRKFKNAPGVYRNRKQDYPNTARKANRQFDHNGLMLSPRQLARVQGVPDNFFIPMYSDKMGYWINKGRAAVTKTPPMEISKWFKQQLDKSKRLWLPQNNA